ncbi:MAG TPA: cysteine dioxygenase family protein [Syntrophales bacterium]|jgi:predicted metal-dependent enzyme (double-stranded beta helix superfamily)|nr:cysteine dioxygenase family protein [Syntrophales bacterium]HON22497.1 cysteine dioxygenase family protein [Syntrophales bacterium]HOU77217.1 cysteine dioxygenase family protein [Syntrophales bacterium]HPC32018.1 cysteine dioxygenase family protein [Syntrophales bacterium]HQG33765.1 cysteine dioxygenase family protein [Syntrophales bacterium]
MHKDFEMFCRRFGAVAAGNADAAAVVSEGIPLVRELVSSDLWWRDFVREALVGRSWFQQHPPTLWPNEMTLYRSPDQSFLVLAYIWEPHSVDTIHDHGSWGIVGSFVNDIREVKYRRLDDGSTAGHAELEETLDQVLRPGEITTVFPLDEGIHHMENVAETMAVTINVYGRSVRRGYLRFFDRERNTVRRVYPPRTFREVLMVRTLGVMGGAGDILEEALRQPLPDYVREEYLAALK